VAIHHAPHTHAHSHAHKRALPGIMRGGRGRNREGGWVACSVRRGRPQTNQAHIAPQVPAWIGRAAAGVGTRISSIFLSSGLSLLASAAALSELVACSGALERHWQKHRQKHRRQAFGAHLRGPCTCWRPCLLRERRKQSATANEQGGCMTLSLPPPTKFHGRQRIYLGDDWSDIGRRASSILR
jgi:hypothetical protein